MRKGSATASDREVLQAKLAAIKAEQEKVSEEKKALALKTETLRRSMSNAEASPGPKEKVTSPRVPATPSVSAAPSPAVGRVSLNRGTSDIDREIAMEKKRLAAMEEEMKRTQAASSLSVAQDDVMEQMLRKAEEEATRQEVARRAAKAKEEERRQEEVLRRAEEEAVRSEAERQAAAARAKENERRKVEAVPGKADDSGESESADETSSDSEEVVSREAQQVPLSELQEALRSMSSQVTARNDGAIVRLCGVATRKAVQLVEESGSDTDFASSVQMLIVDLNKQMVALLKSRYEAASLADAEDVISATLRVLSSGMLTQ
jgi:hypothetical protein